MKRSTVDARAEHPLPPGYSLFLSKSINNSPVIVNVELMRKRTTSTLIFAQDVVTLPQSLVIHHLSGKLLSDLKNLVMAN